MRKLVFLCSILIMFGCSEDERSNSIPDSAELNYIDTNEDNANVKNTITITNDLEVYLTGDVGDDFWIAKYSLEPLKKEWSHVLGKITDSTHFAVGEEVLPTGSGCLFKTYNNIEDDFWDTNVLTFVDNDGNVVWMLDGRDYDSALAFPPNRYERTTMSEALDGGYLVHGKFNNSQALLANKLVKISTDGEIISITDIDRGDLVQIITQSDGYLLVYVRKLIKVNEDLETQWDFELRYDNVDVNLAENGEIVILGRAASGGNRFSNVKVISDQGALLFTFQNETAFEDILRASSGNYIAVAGDSIYQLDQDGETLRREKIVTIPEVLTFNFSNLQKVNGRFYAIVSVSENLRIVEVRKIHFTVYDEDLNVLD